MRYLSGELFHQNKFQVKFIGPSLFFPWLLVFYYLTDAFVLVPFMSSASHPHPLCRSSRTQMFFKIGIPKNFTNFTGKHRCFPVKFAKFLRTPSFTEHLRWLLLSILLFTFLLLLLPCRTPTTSLQCCYFLPLKKHFRLYITTTTSSLP